MPRKSKVQKQPDQNRCIMVPSKWRAQVLGRDHLNGKEYCVTVRGTTENLDNDVTIYDAAKVIAEFLEENNSKMEFTKGLIIHIDPL